MKKSFIRSVNNVEGDLNGDVVVSGGGGGGVESVTGTAVDNADPVNPVINMPTIPTKQFVDEIITETGFTLVAQTLTINAGWEWIISDVPYTNLASQNISIAFTAAGYSRIDIVVCNEENSFTLWEGTPSLNTPVSPSIPLNTIQATFFVVTEDAIEPPAPTVTSSLYVAKAEKVTKTFTGTGVVNNLSLGKFSIPHAIALAGTYASVSGFEWLRGSRQYSGKKLSVKNTQVTNITLVHSGASNNKFVFPDATDFVLKPNETVEFLWTNANAMKTTGNFDYVGSISNGGGLGGIESVTGTAVNNTDPLNPVINSTIAIPTLQQVTTAGATTNIPVTINSGGTGVALDVTGSSTNTPIIRAVNSSTGTAIYANSIDGTAISAYSANNKAVQGVSQNNAGVIGISNGSGTGVEAVSESGLAFTAGIPATSTYDIAYFSKGNSVLVVITNLGSVRATSFIKAGGDGTNILLDNGTTAPLSAQKIVTNTTYTILPTDANYTIFFDNASPITVTLNEGLPDNFECDFYNLGAGSVTFVSGTATLSTPDGVVLTTDKVASLIRFMATSTYKLKGELV